MSDDNIATRLKFLINKLGINSSVFADTCGISRATLSQLLTGRNKKINDILIAQIHKAYPDVSIMWLLFNEGEMWEKDREKNPPSSESTIPSERNVDSDSLQVSESLMETPSGIHDDFLSSDRKNPADNPEFPSDSRSNGNFSKESGLNIIDKQLKNSIDQEINTRVKTVALMNEIEILRSKIKKVVQITIYYDDNTFESFYPK